MMAAKSVKPRGTYSASLAFFHMLSCQREGLMRLPQVILAAAISLGDAAAAAASSLIPMPPGAFLHANSGIDAVRWRHRHSRPFFGAGVATVSVAAIPTVPAQAARREALPQAQKFSGATFRVVVAGSIRRPRARVAPDEHGISLRVGPSAEES